MLSRRVIGAGYQVVHVLQGLSLYIYANVYLLFTATCMEDILRKLIHFQERETRELLGKNSHRLGRIVSSRNGPHGMTEIWEEGTAHKVKPSLIKGVLW